MTVVRPERVLPETFAAFRDRVAIVDARAAAIDGYPSIGEAVWRDFDHPGADSAVFVVDDAAVAHVARSDTFAPRHWSIGVAVDPVARPTGVRDCLLAAAADHIAARGGGRAAYWLLGASDGDDDEIARSGFCPTRDLLEMRAPLPIDEQPRWPQGITVRCFEPGVDETAWLAVNNRAFANHAEQGGWVAETLQRRMSERWFDASLFFLALDDEGLAGFNWCKIHEAHGREPLLGEIFVIGTDPRAQGTGLGRALALHGLGALYARGTRTGMLFCAADNTPALELYRSIGFTVHRVDRAYEREVGST
jgi:mycothiol synthase